MLPLYAKRLGYKSEGSKFITCGYTKTFLSICFGFEEVHVIWFFVEIMLCTSKFSILQNLKWLGRDSGLKYWVLVYLSLVES